MIDVAVPGDARVYEKELGNGTKEAVESENENDFDSDGCSRNSTQKPGEKPKESRNNDKCWVAPEDCTPWNST